MRDLGTHAHKSDAPKQIIQHLKCFFFLNVKVLYAFYGNILEYKSNNRDGGKEGLNYLQSELETEME